MSGPLEVTAIDAMNMSEFVLYFSDETVVKISAIELANCFPERDPITEFAQIEDPT
jgi:hypothetical protein